jgi:hypothetical protein
MYHPESEYNLVFDRQLGSGYFLLTSWKAIQGEQGIASLLGIDYTRLTQC